MLNCATRTKVGMVNDIAKYTEFSIQNNDVEYRQWKTEHPMQTNGSLWCSQLDLLQLLSIRIIFYFTLLTELWTVSSLFILNFLKKNLK